MPPATRRPVRSSLVSRSRSEVSMHARPLPRAARPDRGIALLSVVTVIVALIVIAIPFAISMRLGRDRTESSSYRARAAFEADLIVRAVESYLRGTTPYF